MSRVLGVYALSGLLLGTALTSCAGSERLPASTATGSAFSTRHASDLVVSLCVAVQQAREAEGSAARTFSDRIHLPLHQYIASVEEEDRALAARTLRAKNTVESDLASGAEPSVLERDLLKLLLAIQEAASLTHDLSLTCPNQDERNDP
jgi:hypothetical protein